MTRGNILLVDDDPGFLTVLTKMLNKILTIRGDGVTTAANPAGAMEAIRNNE